MSKRVLLIILSLLIVCTSCIFAFADEEESNPNTYEIPRIYDYRDKLSDEQEKLFTKRSKIIENQYKIRLIGMTITTDNDDPFYFSKIYRQILPNNEEAVFLYIEDDGTCNIYGCGYITKLISGQTVTDMENAISEKLRKSGYYEAFSEFIELCGKICKENGIDLDKNSETDIETKTDTDTEPVIDNPDIVKPSKKPKEPMSAAEKFGIVFAVAGGIGISFLSCNYLKKRSCVSANVIDCQYLDNNDFKFVKTQEKLVKKSIVKKSDGREI